MSLTRLPGFTVDSTSNFTFANANVTGNLIAGNANVSGNVTAAYFIGNGSQLTGLPAGYSNSNVAAYLPTFSGNITSGNANLGNIVIATYYSGNGYLLSGITGANITGTVANANYSTFAGTVLTNSQPNITSVGTLSGLIVSGNTAITGNLTVTGNIEYNNVTQLYIDDPVIELGGGANGAALTTNDGMDRGVQLHYYTTTTVDGFMGWKNSAGEFVFASNASVANNVATINTYGNIHAGNANLGNLATSNYFIGNGYLLTSVNGANIIGNISGNTSNANYSTFAGTVLTNSQPNITSVGTLSSLTVSGLITATNTGIKVANIQDSTGTTTIATKYNNNAGDVGIYGNLTVGTSGTGGITTSGNVTFTGSPNVTLGAVGNLHITGGTSGQYLKTDGTGNLSWAAASGGGGSSFAYTAATTPPTPSNVGDQWFNTTTNTLYEYMNDGTSSYWVDIQTPSVATVASTSAYNVAGFNTRTYTGDGTTVNFTVTTGLIPSTVLVIEDGVVQMPTTDYTISGTVLTFTSAPPSGVVIQIRELGFAVPTTTSLASVSSVTVNGNLTVTGNTVLGSNANVSITGGTNGQVLTTNGAGALSWGQGGQSNTSIRAQAMTMGIIFGG